MDITQQNKQEFMQELVTFSPKYNAVNAERIADNLDAATIEKMILMLRKINDAEAARLDELEAKDPQAYEQALLARQQAEEEADNAYFTELEKQMQEGMQPFDQGLNSVKHEIDSVSAHLDAMIENDMSEAKEMIEQLLQE